MTTERFLNRFAEQPSFAQLMAQLRQPAACVHASHLAGSARSVLGAAAARQLGGLHLFILNERDEAAYFYNDLYNLLGERDVLFFPSSYRRNIAHGEEDSAAAIQRTTALAAIAEAGKRKQLLVVGYPESVAEKVVSGEALQRNTLTLHVGEKLGMDFVRDTLLEYLFERCDFVYEPGQFAIRGSIIDVFSYSDSKPYRIDFFGNEVESLRSFNLNTQLSDEKRSEVEIVPNLRRTESERISLFDFVGKQSRDKGFGVTAWVNDLSFAAEKINAMADGKTAADKDFSAVVIGSAELENSLRGLRRVLLSKPVSGSQQGMSECAFGTASQPAFNKNYELLASTLLENEAAGYANLLLTESLLQAERLDGILTGMASASPAAQRHSKLYEQLPLVLHEGFTCHASKLCCYTDHQLFARYHRYKLHGAPEKSEQLTIQELNSLQVGDYVVHIDHGVGTFGGLVKQRVANGKMCEFIKITYRDGDVLMVSVHGLHRISRFRGREGGEPPKIYKLGSGAWQRLKSAAKSKVKDIARDLIKLYAQRKQTQGFAFAPDTYLQHELEASFMYEDTPDQLKTTLAVKSDMEAEAPMDRLICGDVGFGKTEIAIRAAFKAVADSKQVAVLVPTTLLALQHHKTFCRRLRHFPCRTEYLSRFKSAGEVKAIADDLAEGKIDIIIGTHKLLGKGVSFKDLGLLIIDEEQKFGVAAKEKLRQLRLDVDTLTLTATPIPRTLQFSLMGARDLSVIHTPPPNRQPVATAVHTFDEDVIREAVEQELARGGQVFFVHNHVKDIADIEGIVRRICPRARTTCAHGQMEGNEMEKRVIDFVLGEYDVLVATSIVENGIDIPNANTIIINDAHHFGLSDLHQLRGRVGRSNRKAYCYLLAPPESLLSGDARRRLRALEEFSDLGSGFNIAMQDLDIRGAGNLLGGEQSGFIAEMGFEAYQRILGEAMVELHEEEALQAPDEEPTDTPSTTPADGQPSVSASQMAGGWGAGVFVADCAIETDLELLIPDSYVSNTAEKIRLYREMDDLKTEPEIEDFRSRLADRFGHIPPETDELLNVIRLRQAAIRLGLEKIILKNGLMVCYFVGSPNSPYYKSPTFARLMQHIAAHPLQCKMKEQNGKLEMMVGHVSNVGQALFRVREFGV